MLYHGAVSRKNRMRPCLQDRAFHVFNSLYMLILLVVIGYPLLFIIFASFEGAPSTMTLSLFPKKWSIECYKAIIEYQWIWVGYLDSAMRSFLPGSSESESGYAASTHTTRPTNVPTTVYMALFK